MLELAYFLKKIAREFPDLELNRVKHLTHGFDHDVIIIGKTAVFRFPRTGLYARKLKNELALLRYLSHQVSIVIPNYEYRPKRGDFAGYAYIEGRELSPSFARALDPRDKTSLTKQLAVFLTELHLLNRRIARTCRAENVDEIKGLTNLERGLAKSVLPRLSSAEVELIRRYFDDSRILLGTAQARVLVHNDLTPDNMFWHQADRQLAVIDFSDFIFSDPAKDFAGLYEFGADFVKTVYRKYEGPKDRQLLARARAYYSKVPLQLMLLSSKNTNHDFSKAFALFRRRLMVQD